MRGAAPLPPFFGSTVWEMQLMRQCVLFSILLVASAAGATDPPKVVAVQPSRPGEWAEHKCERGRILRLAADPASKWTLVDDDGADLFVCDDGKFGDFAAPEPGRYKLLVTGPDGSVARVVVAVGDAPPGPKPVPPADPLATKLKAAYDADAEKDLAKRQSHAKDLASVYRLVAKAASDTAFVNASDFIGFARKSATEMVDADSPKGTRCLSGVRDEVSRELLVIFPSDAPLSDEQRKRSAALFLKLATILEKF